MPGPSSAARRAGPATRPIGRGFRRGRAALPQAVRLQHNLGAVLIEAGRSVEAEAPLRAAIAAAPDFAAPYFNLGIVLLHTGRPEEAVEVYRRAATLMPGRPQALAGLGIALRAAGDAEAAIATFERALSIDPQNFAMRWAAALTLPAVHDGEREMAAWRRRWRDGLATIGAALDLASPAEIAAAYAAVTASTDFYLPAQGLDEREDQRAYAGLVERIAAAAMPELAAPRRRRERGPGSGSASASPRPICTGMRSPARMAASSPASTRRGSRSRCSTSVAAGTR